MDKKSKQSKVSIKFTVYFEEPFWIGVIERMYALKQQKKKEKKRGR